METLIENVVENLVSEVIAHLGDDLLVIFITGSYVRKQFASDEPNINLYLVAKPDCYESVNLGYAHLLGNTIENWRNKIEIFVDLHPYLYCKRSLIDSTTRMSFTTAVFDGSARGKRLNMPTTIGNGWNRSYVIKHGEEQVLNELCNTVRLDDHWWNQKEVAFRLYTDQLLALPYVYPWDTRPILLYRESLHYAEEFIRDGIGMYMTDEELCDGRDLEIIHDWRNSLLQHYMDRASNQIIELVKQMMLYKQVPYIEQLDPNMAVRCYEWAMKSAYSFTNELARRHDWNVNRGNG